MKNRKLFLAAVCAIAIAACNKKDDNNTTPATVVTFDSAKKQMPVDFTNNIAVAGYQDLKLASADLYAKIQALNANGTDANLDSSRAAWLRMRGVWERCEGFLFGPVEDNDYDPNMDTWPTDKNQMDSLLTSGAVITAQAVQGYTLSLRGYHPIEYIIFGDHGSRTAASLTAEQKQYMVALTEDLKSTCDALYDSWTTAPANFAQQVMTAGIGSTVYTSRLALYTAIVDGMAGICDEVGNGKMKEPYDAYATDGPQRVESPYAGTSIADFKNNLTGLQNVYMGTYNGKTGIGLKDLVAAKNKSLDLAIQSKIAAAIASFDNITVPYEQAIVSQRTQVKNTMDVINELNDVLENQLKPFIQTNITD
ncbi:imelysin family protein [Chitinophagaceae bacterium MMS25-I14]